MSNDTKASKEPAGSMTKIIREPLLHFLVIGIALFVLFDMVNDQDSGDEEKTL